MFGVLYRRPRRGGAFLLAHGGIDSMTEPVLVALVGGGCALLSSYLTITIGRFLPSADARVDEEIKFRDQLMLRIGELNARVDHLDAELQKAQMTVLKLQHENIYLYGLCIKHNVPEDELCAYRADDEPLALKPSGGAS